MHIPAHLAVGVGLLQQGAEVPQHGLRGALAVRGEVLLRRAQHAVQQQVPARDTGPSLTCSRKKFGSPAC